VGLGKIMGEKMIIIGNLFAIFAMATSFLTLGLALKQMYNYDYRLNKNLSWALTCFVPLAIALSGITSFIKVIGFAGVISGGLEGVLIVLMAMKAKKLGNRKPEFSIPINKIIAGIIIAVFVLGAGYYLWGII
jgi:amino acid permease